MKISIPIFVRLPATVGLIYMVGTETGPWTMAFCALVWIAIEGQAVINRFTRDMAELVALLARKQ